MKPSRFTEFFLLHNDLEDWGFREWHFEPGMLFQSPRMWWGNGERRPASHEGLDLCRFWDKNGKIRSVRAGALFPALYAGRIKAVIPDFLGKTVIIEHPGYQSGTRVLCTLYAHTVPIVYGTDIGEGAAVAGIAGTTGGPRTETPEPHLHLSAAWVRPGTDHTVFRWSTLRDSDDYSLIDPYPFIIPRGADLF